MAHGTQGLATARKTYYLALTWTEWEAVLFASGRYQWATHLSNEMSYTPEEPPSGVVVHGYESDWWDFRQAVESDISGGHSPYPLAGSELADKLDTFLGQFE